MKYNVQLSLNFLNSEKKILDRIYEVKTAAPYLKYPDKPEIIVFQINLSDKDQFKKFLTVTTNCFKNVRYLPFKINGWKKHNEKGNHRLFFSVGTLGESEEIFQKLKNDLANCGIDANFRFHNKEDNYNILIAESKNYAEIEFLWKILGEKISFFSKILFETIYRINKRPIHTPRNFCYSFDILNIIINRDNKKYREYSLPIQEWIRPDDKKIINNILEKYRIVKNYQLSQINHNSDKINTEKIYVTSDLHLDHKDIIDMTARPFGANDLKLMNETLISNWNLTVNHKDTIIFAGDLTYNADFSTFQRYLERLNGKKIFVRGNHDKINCESFPEYEINYKNIKFLFVHNPKDAPKNYDGWIIHGHTHNSRMCDYPFINFINRTINVSCELTEYRPIELNEIVRILKQYRKRGINSIYSIDRIRYLESDF